VIDRKPDFDVEPLLTPAEVADLFKVQPLTVTRWPTRAASARCTRLVAAPDTSKQKSCASWAQEPKR
jgi:hypothetical protein